MPVLFCNVGWMERYEGLRKGDQIVGGGKYVNNVGRGHEVCNFSPYNGSLYGYVQPPRGGNINITRLGANKNDEFIEGVTVIWTATHPSGGATIIGWYKDATVFREYQQFEKIPAIQSRNGIDGYWIKAKESNSTLLPIDARTFEIPRSVKGGMGKSNIWYADRPESKSLLRQVAALVGGRKTNYPSKKGRKREQDQERKVKVEKAAIRECCRYFESLGYSVNSVESDNVGWDLEAKAGRAELRVEVKGLSGSNFSVELTPNEYKAFAAHHVKYRLAVVLNALTSPDLYVCRYSKEQEKWVIDECDDHKLKIQIKESASIKMEIS